MAMWSVVSDIAPMDNTLTPLSEATQRSAAAGLAGEQAAAAAAAAAAARFTTTYAVPAASPARHPGLHVSAAAGGQGQPAGGADDGTKADIWAAGDAPGSAVRNCGWGRAGLQGAAWFE